MTAPLRRTEARPAHPHVLRLRVYYEDTDAGGVVYYANYLRYAERARTELLRGLGIGQRALADETGLIFAVRRLKADFIAPARLDDDLEIVTTVTGTRGASADMEQVVRRGGDELVRLEVRIACVNARGRATRFPPALARAFAGLVAGPAG